MGFIAFCPLAQGFLTDKYLDREKPMGSRLARSADPCANVLERRGEIERIRKLNDLARRRGQTLAQMAMVWLLRRPEVTSVLIGASRPDQIEENVAALDHADFSADELAEIEVILGETSLD
jgi:L-glyceraldehyde 3-phosphate reductase